MYAYDLPLVTGFQEVSAYEWACAMSMFAAIAQTKRNEQKLAQAAPAIVLPAAQPAVSPLDETYSQTASFFIKLRQYLGLTREQAAAHLQTYPFVIAALETGNFADLPPWPHTRRIVWDYAALARIDPTPALHCLELCLEETAQAALRSANTPSQPSVRPNQIATLTQQSADDIDEIHDDAGSDQDDTPQPSLIQRLSACMPSTRLALRISAVMILLSVAGLFTQGWVAQAAMTNLPAPVGSLIREAREAVLLRTSAKFEGMIWIDVADPRSRRADKLPVKPRQRSIRLDKN